MNRDFAILGLEEEASKEQVKQAYVKRSAKYRDIDYADDPAYVNNKLAQLKSAYERAYAIAETPAVKGSEITTTSENRYDRPVYKPREYRSDEYDHDDSQPGKGKVRDEAEGRMRMPDLHKLKDVAKATGKNLKETVARKVDEINGADDVPSSKLEPESGDTYANSGSELTPVPTSKSDDFGVVKVLIGIVVFMVLLLTQCGGEDDFYEYEDDHVVYSHEYATTEDQRVYDLGEEIRDVLYESEITEEFTENEYEPADIQKATDKFAKRYFDGKSLEDKGTELYDAYGEFPVTGDIDADSLIREMLDFYGFPYLEDITGYINKYNNEPITNIVEYVRFLNQYYYYEVMEIKKGA